MRQKKINSRTYIEKSRKKIRSNFEFIISFENIDDITNKIKKKTEN